MTGSNQSPALLIALTGGIASGKTAVAELFAKLGVPVLDTDQIARDVVAPGMPALGQLVAEFGAEILDAHGKLDRARMRERVFSDPAQRRKLESITHPAIRAELARRSAAAGGDYQVHVIPLLVETGRADAYDRVLVVDCPEAAQIERLLARDGTSREQAEEILAAQVSREERLDAAHDVIENTGTLADLRALRADAAPELRAARAAICMIVWREKLAAFAIHFLVTLLLSASAAALVFLIWFPDPFQEMLGGTRLFKVMVVCDLGLGPLTSFIVYSSRSHAGHCCSTTRLSASCSWRRSSTGSTPWRRSGPST